MIKSGEIVLLVLNKFKNKKNKNNNILVVAGRTDARDAADENKALRQPHADSPPPKSPPTSFPTQHGKYIDQARANEGPGAIGGPLNFLIRPVNLKK